MKKIFSFLKKYQLIISLSLIAGLLIGYKLLFPAPSKKEEQIPFPPTPTLKASNKINERGESERGITEEEFLKSILKDFPLSPYLPYPNKKEAEIRYLAPLSLEIKVIPKNSSPLKEKVLNWIKEKGVDPETHQIIWK